MRQIDLSGIWAVRTEGKEFFRAALPGTLDENKIGARDIGANLWNPDASAGNSKDQTGKGRILTRFTRNYTYEGPAVFCRSVHLAPLHGERLFLEAERSRELSLSFNGREVPCAVPGTLSTPAVYEVTGFAREGKNEIRLCCDNSYPSWPREAIVYSSAATDETQTNWNGLLGYLRLRYEKPSFISDIRVYPDLKTVDIVLELDCRESCTDTLTLSSEAFSSAVTREVSATAGIHKLEFRHIALAENVGYWEEGEGGLYSLSAAGSSLEEKQARFGIRTFTGQNGRLALNGRPIFLRSEANCCVFPETGHMPMTAGEWRSILALYQSYGVNCMRFHSHCPPDAAFAAADELGMLMQPELSHWNPHNAFEEEESWEYYRLELRQILRAYANHPSFVMLTFGNELHAGALGHQRMDRLLQTAKTLDATRLYANGSNVEYGEAGPDPQSDFYTSSNYYDKMIRGTSAEMKGFINRRYPNAQTGFDAELAELRRGFSKPVFNFEVGQYEVLPDFDELSSFQGVTRPDNLQYIRERAAEKGLLPDWKRRVEATGELALLGYREEVEAVMRTGQMSGISLLGLQDFPGQGTALVGMLNSHLQPKPFSFAQPERFRAFFSPVLPLALLEKYTYLNSGSLTAVIRLANYGRRAIHGSCTVRLMDGSRRIAEKTFAQNDFPCGGLSTVGTISFDLHSVRSASRLNLTVQIGPHRNGYPVWVYPDAPFSPPDGAVVTAGVSEALSALRAGKAVLLDPPATEEHFPQSIQAQFTTDFWSVGTFPKQEGFMGCCMDPLHPVFRGFPTEFHSNWQWWPMCRGRSMLLPDSVAPIVTGLDCYARMRKMGLLFEANVGKGRLLLSSMGLLEQREYPEVRGLLASIAAYMGSPEFRPAQAIPADLLRALVK